MRLKSVIVGGVAAALVAAGTVAAHATQTEDPTPFIIGGRPVASAPWAAEMVDSGCSGTIIAPHWVLTAWHCYEDDPGQAKQVRIGNVNRGQGTLVGIKKIYPKHDILLVELDRDVSTTYAKIADVDPPIGAAADIYGWGFTSVTGAGGLSPVLKTARMRVSDIQDLDSGAQVFNLAQTGDGFALPGDSGGPAFWNGMQIGTLCCGSTDTDGSGTETYYGLLRVKDWIKQTSGVSPGGGGTPPPSNTNLALNRPTKTTALCSATESGAKAVNGSVSGGTTDKWCSGAGSSRTIEVDLGSNRSVTRVVVQHAGAGGESAALNTKNFTVQTSTGGGVWQTAATVTGNTSSTTTHTLAANARWVRLAITDPVARIYEFEVY
jgi:hypothetical protein